MTKPLEGLSEHSIVQPDNGFSEVGHVRMRTLKDLALDRIATAYSTIDREKQVIDSLQEVLKLTEGEE